MSIKHICDRCGKEIKAVKNRMVLSQNGKNTYFDFCDDCVLWVKGGLKLYEKGFKK